MKTNRVTKIAVVGTLSAGLALAGCSSTGGDSGDESQSSSQTQEQAESGSDSASAQSSSSDDSGSPLPEDADLSETMPSTSAEDAVKTAQDEIGTKDGTLHAVELDYDSDDGRWEYDVKIMDGSTDHKVVIDADSGEVLRDESESSDDTEKAIDLEKPMTFDEAYDLAKKKASGRLSGWKLEYDDGQREYQFDFDDNGSESEVTVNVESKKVVLD